jgi:hypothetical protein
MKYQHSEATGMLDVALAHLADGWAVFPLQPGSKKPHGLLAPRGVLDATRDETIVRDWWSREPNANVGGATGPRSGIVVVDEDGPVGKAALANHLGDRTLSTRVVTTGRADGGKHYYFGHTAPDIRNAAGIFGEGSKVDVRGDGGYVVLPGSINTETGATYRYVDETAPLTGVPDFLLPILRKQRTATTEKSKDSPSAGWLSELKRAGVRDGERNDKLTRVVGRYAQAVAAMGGDLDDVLALAHQFNDQHVTPPDDGQWLDDCCARLWKKEADKGIVATVDPTAAYRLLTWDALDELTPPEWLVEDVLPTDAFVLLWGIWGAGKTFLALDLALSVATGKPWHGHTVKGGPAVYVAGEGVRGLNQRRVAWATKYNNDEAVNDFYVLPSPVPMLDSAQVSLFADQIEATVGRTPVLIVIDTLARCTPGGDENTQKDMNQFVAEADKLRRRFPEAVVLVLHHPSKAGQVRGSTVLTGAADTILKLDVDDEKLVRTLSCDKMKDSAEFTPTYFRLEAIDPSCVLVPADAPPAAAQASPIKTKLGKQILEALRNRGPSSFTDWRGVANATPSSFKRYVSDLVRAGFAIKDGDTYRVATPEEAADVEDEVENAPF